jgi:hypothetical protein
MSEKNLAALAGLKENTIASSVRIVFLRQIYELLFLSERIAGSKT